MTSDLYYKNNTIIDICKLDKVIIYGAGIMGRALKLCLESDVYRKKVSLFIVMNEEQNPKQIDNCPVIGLDNVDLNKDEPIIVALNEKNMESAKRELRERGFCNLILLDAASDSWSYIKGNYFLSTDTEKYLPFEPVNRTVCNTDISKLLEIFIAKSVYDRENIQAKEVHSYEQDIQVGAALTDRILCDLRDDVGDNISSKNKQYCELTALYWIWKHIRSEYLGLSHYRRRFDIDDEEINWILENNVDIVVTIPVINTRGIGEQYGLSHSKKDWCILKEEIHRLWPEYDESIEYVQQQIYFFPCNMFIMRREVLNEYCEWLFPILFACESRIGAKEETYQNRYSGFMAERLLNVFLYHNKSNYKICVAKRKYLGCLE